MESDRFLVTRARGGDVNAFAALLARHRAGLLRAAGSPDVGQEAALTAWLQLERLRDRERFGAWLAGIGRVMALRARRAARRVQRGPGCGFRGWLRGPRRGGPRGYEPIPSLVSGAGPMTVA